MGIINEHQYQPTSKVLLKCGIGANGIKWPIKGKSGHKVDSPAMREKAKKI